MAQPSSEVEVIAGGIVTNNAVNSSFVQNMYHKQGNWNVREGFGQLGQFDTTFSRWTVSSRIGLNENEGIQNHLGSHHIETGFGHEQIISVFEASVFMNNLIVGEPAAGVSAYNLRDHNDRVLVYWIHVYDLTTGDSYEELLLNNRNPSNLPTWRGTYEWNGQFSDPKVRSGAGKSAVSFVEVNDTLFFSSPEIGTYYYRPSILRGNRGKTLKGPQERNYYSENSLTKEVILSPNRPYQESGYLYYDFFPEAINAVTLLGDRVVYASDKTLYVSDPFMPTSITLLNSIRIPTDGVITACHEINGSLLVFTKSETYIVQPPATFELGHARVTKINSTIGCTNNRLICMEENTLTWVDQNGVHQNNGQLEIRTVSGNIDAFFKDFMSNPLSHYLIETGECSSTADQPQIQNWLESEFASLSYSPRLKLLFLTIPAQRISLCQSANGEWSLWSYDSAAYFEEELGVDTPKVGVRKNMDCTQLVCSKDNIYAIGLDLENKITLDSAKRYSGAVWLTSPDRSQQFRSFYISQYGLGGGTDRNTNYEDNRYGIGEWTVTEATSAFPPEDPGGANKVAYAYEYLIFGKPLLLEKGKTSGYEADDATALIPVYMNSTISRVLSQTHQLKHLRIKFSLDTENWLPTISTAGAQQVLRLITPNSMSTLTAGLGFWNANWTMVAGDYMSESLGNGAFQIDWSASQYHATGLQSQFWNQQHHAVNPLNEPELPLVYNQNTLLFYIPVKKINPNLSVSTMNIIVTEGYVFYDFYGAYPGGATVWDRTKNFVYNASSLGFKKSEAGIDDLNHDLRYEDVVAQGVDWCYSSAPLGIADANRYKARGTYTQIKSKGTSEDQIINSWGVAATGFNNNMPRVFNTVVSSENRQWNSQIVDYGSNTEGIKQNETLAQTTSSSPSIITKILDVTNNMRLKVFNYTTSLWGQKGTQTGSVLIDDSQFSTIANSNSTRGSWVNWMFFGHILNRAEKLVLKSSKAAMRKLGGRRRRGK